MEDLSFGMEVVFGSWRFNEVVIWLKSVLIMELKVGIEIWGEVMGGSLVLVRRFCRRFVLSFLRFFFLWVFFV